MTQGLAAVNGTSLYYESAGEGMPVVFVHGLCLDTRMWDDQFEAAAEHFRAIRYDVRGFGKSSRPDGRPFRHADDLRALLAYLDLPQANVVGLSMGGRIALHHALLYPEATRSLVLVDSALDGYDWSDEWVASLDAISECAQREGPAAANAMWLHHELFASARDRASCAARLAQIVGDDSGWNWVNESYAQGIVPPGGSRLHEVAAQTLVIVGERDLDDFQRISERLGDEIRSASKAVIVGAGHMSNMEEPEKFNGLLFDFLAATSAKT